jgi:hypothetical protein
MGDLLSLVRVGQLKHEPPAPVNPESPQAPTCFNTLPTELKNKIYGYTLEPPKLLPHVSEAPQRLPQNPLLPFRLPFISAEMPELKM